MPTIQAPAKVLSGRSTNVASETFDSLQVLRAFAALAVAAAHLPRMEAIVSGASYGAIGVDVFFVISGFIMVHTSSQQFSKLGAGRVFMAKRVARILPLYWLATVSAAVFWLLIGQQYLVTPQSVLSSLFFIPIGTGMPINGVGWTLNYEMFFYCLFSLAMWLPRSQALISLTVVFVVLAVAHRVVSFPPPLSFWSDPIILEFLFGIWLAEARLRGARVSPLIALVLVVAALALLLVGGWAGYYARSLEDTTFPRALAWGAPSAMIVAALTLCRYNWTPRSALGRLLLSVGNASYALYLFHFLINYFVVTHGVPFLLNPSVAAAHPQIVGWAEFLMMVALVIPVSILLQKFSTRCFEVPAKVAMLRSPVLVR